MNAVSSLTVIYSRFRTLGSPLIRHADRFGRWSHCGILTPDFSVIEARAFHGVVETPVSVFNRRASHQELRQVECPNPDAAIDFAREQIGKGYDYGAVLGLLLRESWEDDSRWHCAELVEAALVAGGRRRFLSEAWRISPNMSFIVA